MSIHLPNLSSQRAGIMGPAIIALTAVLLLAACAPVALTDAAATLDEAAPIGASTPTVTLTAAAGPDKTQEPATLRTFVIDPQASTATYRAYEEFFGRAINTHAPWTLPIGSTSEITGAITVGLTDDGLYIEPDELVVNLRSLTSDDARRDKQLRDNYLESADYPLAGFVPETISNFPANYQLGEPAGFQMSGALTIRNITNPVTFDVNALLAGDTISATATARLNMPDFDLYPPRMQNFVVVQDHLDITLEIQAAAE